MAKFPSALPNPFTLNRSTANSSPRPTQIRNTFYKNLRDFTAWNPWGNPPDHTRNNENYISVKGAFVKQFDYPAKLQQLIDFGWKTASAPKNVARGNSGFLAGGHRVAKGQQIDLTQNGQVSALRRGFARPQRSDWAHVTEFEQVSAYSFRGDTRPPDAIHAANGFHPPASRTDDSYMELIAKEFYQFMTRREGLTLDEPLRSAFIREVVGYLRAQPPTDRKLFAEFHFWKTILDKEQMHLRGMTTDPLLKAYVSTTREVRVAREGSNGSLGTAGASNDFGWVYAVKVDSGFLIKKGVGGVTMNEAEIAKLGSIAWKDVYGFVGSSPTETNVYIRNMFDLEDYEAFKLVLASLSTVA